MAIMKSTYTAALAVLLVTSAVSSAESAIEEKYDVYLQTSGKCVGSDTISTAWTCEASNKLMNFCPDLTAKLVNSYFKPRGCYCDSGQLYFNDRRNLASTTCSLTNKCICRQSRVRKYIKITNGTCPLNETITSRASCMRAARAMDPKLDFCKADRGSPLNVGSSYPTGCSCTNRNTFLGASDTSVKKACTSVNPCFCDKGPVADCSLGSDCECCINDKCGSKSQCAALRNIFHGLILTSILIPSICCLGIFGGLYCLCMQRKKQENAARQAFSTAPPIYAGSQPQVYGVQPGVAMVPAQQIYASQGMQQPQVVYGQAQQGQQGQPQVVYGQAQQGQPQVVYGQAQQGQPQVVYGKAQQAQQVQQGQPQVVYGQAQQVQQGQPQVVYGQAQQGQPQVVNGQAQQGVQQGQAQVAYANQVPLATTQVSSVPPVGGNMLSITVPPGYGPGKTLKLKVNGKEHKVKIPQGKLPGSTFQVNVDLLPK